MRLAIRHTTSYGYSEPARRIVQLLKATPASFAGQTVLDWRVDVDCDAKLREGRDGYGNVTHMLYIDRPVDRLAITVAGRVLTEDKAGVVQGVPHELPPLVFTRETALTAAGKAVAGLAAEVGRAAESGLERMHRLAARLHEALRFDAGATEVDTPAEAALAAGHGVCQDFAHIFIAAARRLGLPARYVSGHLYRRDGDHEQEASHAWAEAWIEHLGWTAFDPVHGICTDDAYVRVACGLDYRDAAPVAGARAGGGEESLGVEVRVEEARRQARAHPQD